MTYHVTRGPKRNKDTHEEHNRLDWWLREYGHPPTREVIIAMRGHKDFAPPKQGKSKTSRRIAKAVDDYEWQMFRHGLKGTTTEAKLFSLKDYWNSNLHGHVIKKSDASWGVDVLAYDCDICIRIDNYIKALCRGGQLYAGESLFTALDAAWNLKIKS